MAETMAMALKGINLLNKSYAHWKTSNTLTFRLQSYD
jgi:hypothetical protein